MVYLLHWRDYQHIPSFHCFASISFLNQNSYSLPSAFSVLSCALPLIFNLPLWQFQSELITTIRKHLSLVLYYCTRSLSKNKVLVGVVSWLIVIAGGHAIEIPGLSPK